MTPTQSPLDLEAIEARCAVATPGPWYAMDGAIEGFDDSWDVCGSDHCGIAGITGTAEVARFPRNKELNAEFIAHARTDVEQLVAEVRRLREVVAEREGHIELLREACESARQAIVDMWGSRCLGKNGKARNKLAAALAASQATEPTREAKP